MARRLDADDLRDILGRICLIADDADSFDEDLTPDELRQLLAEVRQESSAAIDGYVDPRTRYYAHRREQAKTQGRPRSPLWRAARRAHLLREPVCQACGSITSLQVHHVEPFWVAPERELDPTNLITLCEGDVRSCHFTLAHLYDWKRWNPHVREDVALFRSRIIAYK